MTRALLADINDRNAGVPITSRLSKLAKSFSSLGVALLLPALLLPQAKAANDVNTVDEGRKAGADMAKNIASLAIPAWQARQQNRQTPVMQTGTIKEGEIEAARKEYALAIGADIKARQQVGKDNPALKATVEAYSGWETRAKTQGLPPKIREGIFLSMYRDQTETTPTTPAFDAVIRENCQRLGVPEPAAQKVKAQEAPELGR